MITGNLVGELKVDGETNDKLVVSANQTKTFEVEVINKNNREARFNFYYKGSLPENVEAGYVSGDGYNPMVKEVGVNLTANGSLGYFLKYQIKVKNNTSGSITIPIGYSIGLDYNDLSLPSNCYLFEEAKSNTAVDVLLANYTNSESTQDYNINYTKTDKTAKENKMYVFNHESNKGTQQSDWSSDELKDYRYIGADPNNYVTFNNEEAGWRIIGIETVDNGTGTKEKRIKLIRKDFLTPDITWDNKPSGTGSAASSSRKYGSSEWTDARLMYLLNPNYEDEQTGVSGSIYWNRQSGNCPHDSAPVDNRTTTCDFSEVGLLPDAQKMIGDAKWFLGATENFKEANNGTSNHWYSYERGEEKVYSSRKENWTGRVGLIYPSDYGFATSGGSSTNRTTCLATELYNWNNNSDCYNNNWLFNSSKTQWTISPYIGVDVYYMSINKNPDISPIPFDDGTVSYGVFTLNSQGNVSNGAVYSYYGVRPVVYLRADILYQSGDGSRSNPFVFTGDPSADYEAPVCKLTSSSATTDTYKKGGEGTFIIECTDNSGSLKNDLTSDNINFGYKHCKTDTDKKSYDIKATLSNTETITGGKRYTFTINADDNTTWFEHCNEVHFIEIKGGVISDNSSNQNIKNQFEFEVSAYSTGSSSGVCSSCSVATDPT